jgi:transposase
LNDLPDWCNEVPYQIKSIAGEVVKNLGGSKIIKSPFTNQTMDRDLNGARGIFLRALVDTPWLVENLACWVQIWLMYLLIYVSEKVSVKKYILQSFKSCNCL